MCAALPRYCCYEATSERQISLSTLTLSCQCRATQRLHWTALFTNILVLMHSFIYGPGDAGEAAADTGA